MSPDDNSAPVAAEPQVSVSVLVPILNEARFIRDTLPPMLDQRFDEGIEFLLLDGGSEDGTLEILEEIAEADPRVRLVDNPRRYQSSALNIGLSQARGQFICRMDAHTYYPAEYVAVGVERLRRGDVAWVAGPAVPAGFDDWSDRIALALSSRMGIGGARFRSVEDEEFETDTGFTGLIDASILREVGGWAEDWLINEDGELAARITEAGGKIVCVPSMAARFVPRDSVPALSRQYWRYGQGRAQTWRRHRSSLRRSHLLPPALVATTAGALIGPRASRTICRVALGVYGVGLAGECLRLSRRAGPRDAAACVPIFMAMHYSWGSAFIYGLATKRSVS